MILFLTTILTLTFQLCIAADWNYDDTDSWKHHYPGCNGQSQSPINIVVNSVKVNLSKQIFRHNYDIKLKNAIAKNNGHTIQISLNSNESKRPFITGTALDGKTYLFEQMHFHWSNDTKNGSEHAINGKKFSGEIHLVHYNREYHNIKAAQEKPDGLAVIGIFVSESSPTENFALKPIFSAIPKVIEFDKTTLINEPIILDHLIPKPNIFIQYKGSLTTPPCYESVKWILLSNPLHLSSKQFAQLRRIKEAPRNGVAHKLENNDRKIQPLNNRIVISSGTISIWNSTTKG